MSNFIWFRYPRRGPEADITNLGLAVGTDQPSVCASYLGALSVQKFEFSDVNEGGRCHFQEQLVEYPIVNTITEYVRDSVDTRASRDNFPTNNRLGAIVKTVSG